MVEPSSKVVWATKAPRAGGFDLEIVKSRPPVFWRVKLIVFGLPVTTVPKSRLIGVITRLPGVPEAPASGTVTLPPSVATESALVNEPAFVGENLTLNVVEAPAA